MHVRSVIWIADSAAGPVPGHVRILDQTRLPGHIAYIDTRDIAVVWQAIRQLQVRGAPAIGIAAAMGLAAAAQEIAAVSTDQLVAAIRQHADYLATARPTAVNLFWALDRMRTVVDRNKERSPAAVIAAMAGEAIRIRDEDAAMCRAIGEHGAGLLRDGGAVLTHCNAGALATAELGTALAPVYVAHEQGRRIHVYADETRPLLQGARLTAWELMQAGVAVTLICDNTAAQVMREKRVDLVMVGADRIAGNGDAANKIGTYGVACLARAHGIPFYVLAPSSTFDTKTPTGADIPIEERAAEEVTEGFGIRTAPAGVRVYSPAFDVTPATLIDGIICEAGILRPPFAPAIAAACRRT